MDAVPGRNAVLLAHELHKLTIIPMANIATLLKQEISRLVRRELKSETETLKKASARYRSEIAELKRRITTLEQRLKAAERQNRKQAALSAPIAEPAGNIRFRKDGLKKHRERLGLSAPVLASILGVSPQTIYNWEAGASKPSQDQVSCMSKPLT
jgi:DNA-binding transcriptional regulator YiaG